MRKLVLDRDDFVTRELALIGVDQDAYGLFLKKSGHQVLKFENMSCAQANVLKQIALVCGADVAIPKNAYQGGGRKKFCAILFANEREIEKMMGRLKEQPWMKSIGDELSAIFTDQAARILKIGKEEIRFDRTFVMGVVNVTPDSFYSGSRYTTNAVLERVAKEMVEEGADFIDVGAESTQPGIEPIDEEEEIRRLEAVLPTLVRNLKIPISVDTYKSKVAAFAIDQGASLINDISGLGFDKRMARLIAKNKVGLVIMHIKGTPKTMQLNPVYDDLMGEIYNFLKTRLDFALQSGISGESIMIDPGLGFGKKLEDNYEIIRRLAELKLLGRPIVVGHSRKSFIGAPSSLPPEQRLEGTLGVEALLIANGASVVRVHDVQEAKRVAMLVDRIRQ